MHEVRAADTDWRQTLPRIVGTLGLTLALLLLSRLLGASGAVERVPVPGRDIALAVHLAATLTALPLGGFVLWRRKGDAGHKLLGRAWALLMLAAAISSYWLRTITGGFSFIHLLSVLTIVSVPLGIYYARRGNIPAHLKTMRGLYIGLCVAGLFALSPSRTVGHFLFG
jgi:uncharacterized membrane protein